MDDDEALRSALLTAEAGLRDAIQRLDPRLDSDRPALKDLQESLGLIGGWRRELEAGRWRGGMPSGPTSPKPRR